MDIEETSLPGCFLIKPVVRGDGRGRFVKLFQRSVFEAAGLETVFNEHLSSRSSKGVVRGLHFQLPPFTQGKLVYCTDGEVFDVALDLRKGSPTYGKHHTFHLTGENGQAAWIPEGFGHGFAALTDASMVYFASGGEFNAESDGGVRWDTADIDWPVSDPTLSDKDTNLPALADFDSPWEYQA